MCHWHSRASSAIYPFLPVFEMETGETVGFTKLFCCIYTSSVRKRVLIGVIVLMLTVYIVLGTIHAMYSVGRGISGTPAALKMPTYILCRTM
jgi:hypothetical protein